MKPILYDKNSSSWYDQGLGALSDALKCEVTEERNGIYELELVYPTDGIHYSEIEKGALIKAKPNDTSAPQVFRIYRCGKEIKKRVTFYGEHISYDLNGYPIPLITEQTLTAQSAILVAMANSSITIPGFTAWSNISTQKAFRNDKPRSMRAVLGGSDNSILDIYGGEYEFDNKLIRLWQSRGSNNGVKIVYGKNLTDLKQDENIADMYTHLFPYARSQVDGTERIVTLTNNATIQIIEGTLIGHEKCLIADLTDYFENGEEITNQKLRSAAQSYIASHDLATPKINITVSFYPLWQSIDYQEFAPLEHVSLCDTVTVTFKELGVDASAKVIKTVYDSLKERYVKIELGNAKSSFSDSFYKAIEEQKADLNYLKNGIPQQISSAATLIQNWQKDFSEKMNNAFGLNSDTINGKLYFFNSTAIANATYIFTINDNGVAWTSGPNCWHSGSPSWQYGFDATGGGILATLMAREIIADIITAGKLRSVDGNVVFDLDAGTIKIKNSYPSGAVGGNVTTLAADEAIFSNPVQIFNNWTSAGVTDLARVGQYPGKDTVRAFLFDDYGKVEELYVGAEDPDLTVYIGRGVTAKDGVVDCTEISCKSLSIDHDDLTEFIVDSGTSNGWNYEEYNTGKYKCWREVYVSGTMPTSITSDVGFYTITCSSIAYPKTFSTRPTQFISWTKEAGNCFLVHTGINTTSATGNIAICCNKSGGGNNVSGRVTIEVIGT